MVICLGCPDPEGTPRFMSRRRSVSWSTAARRWKMRLSQYSTCEEHTAVDASRSMAISKPARTFQDLLVWQKAHRFVLEVYALTAAFPKQETYGLSLQIR